MPKLAGALTQQAAALGTLKAFAELHTLALEGRTMTGDERGKSIAPNLALHFGMQLCCVALKGYEKLMYDEVLSPLIKKHEQQVGVILPQMDATVQRIIEAAKNTATDKKNSKELVKEIALFSEQKGALLAELKKLSPQSAGKIEATKKILEEHYRRINAGIELKLQELGTFLPDAVRQSNTLRMIDYNRFEAGKDDFKTIKKLFEDNGGAFEHIEHNLYKATQNGKSVYFEKLVKEEEIGKN